MLGLLLGLAGPVRAQLVESFTDGDFTQNPAWTGDVSGFQVTAQQLQSNGPAVTGTALELVTPCQASTGTTWEFWANLKFATSSANYADVWLMADQASVKATGTKGYFVRIGGTNDEVSLFRKDAAATPVYVVNGADGTVSSTTNNLVRVRVTRSVQDVWTLERDLAGGTTYVSEGTGPDATYQRSAYCGVSVLYSSANNRAFFFDDFRITDATAPVLLRATAPTARQVDVTFNEALATPAAASYQLNAGAPVVLSATRDATDPGVVHLTLATDLPAGTNTLTARSVADLYGNASPFPATTPVTYAPPASAPGINQLLITEIMADELPVVGLPASEFIEIYNPSATVTLDLAGIRLLRPGSTSTPAVFAAGALLLPGEYAVVCSSTRTALFTPFGKTFGLTNFPALNNAGDELVLRAASGRTIFEVRYSDTWYRDVVKKDGGWTLEMIDTANPCGGASNWLASNDPSGGTPARANSVRAANADTAPPRLRRATLTAPDVLRLDFDEKLDSVQISNPALYTITPALGIQSVRAVPYDFRSVELTLTAAVPTGPTFTVTVQRARGLRGQRHRCGRVGHVRRAGSPADQSAAHHRNHGRRNAGGGAAGFGVHRNLQSHRQYPHAGGGAAAAPGQHYHPGRVSDTTALAPGQYAVVCSSYPHGAVCRLRDRVRAHQLSRAQ